MDAVNPLSAVELPCGSDGKDRVTIFVSEIASYRGHTVVSYSYQDWTEVTLKNGVKYDCKVSHRDFTDMIRKAVN